ncbi:hypothetical protein COCNU_contig69077662G000010 [Cocos nucifera]|nr:hypothetical protein [Cocos nucifera]
MILHVDGTETGEEAEKVSISKATSPNKKENKKETVREKKILIQHRIRIRKALFPLGSPPPPSPPSPSETAGGSIYENNQSKSMAAAGSPCDLRSPEAVSGVGE